jgi:hypothetical protein
VTHEARRREAASLLFKAAALMRLDDDAATRGAAHAIEQVAEELGHGRPHRSPVIDAALAAARPLACGQSTELAEPPEVLP